MASVIEKARRIGRRGLVVLSVTATMAISGVAFASWTLTGTGTGTADAAVAATLASELSVPTNLYPGLTTDATLSVTNPNDFPVEVTAVTFTGTVEVGTPADGCTDVNSQVSFADASDLTFTIAADSTDTTTLASIVVMGVTADDECQGKTFTQDFDLTANIG